MTDLLEKLKEFKEVLSLVGKVLVPLLGIGSSGTALFKSSMGGKKVFEGFAAKNLLIVNADEFDASHLSEWAMEIISRPINDICSAEPHVLVLYIIIILTTAILIFLHLLSREEKREGLFFYQKVHPYVTIGIFTVLLLTVFLSRDPPLMFLSLILLAIFFSVYMYLHVKDIKIGSKGDKLAWLFSWVVLLLAVMFVPNTYGHRFFDPAVYCKEYIDKDSKEIKVTTRSATLLFYHGKRDEKEFVLVGFLHPPQADGKRTLTLKESSEDQDISASFFQKRQKWSLQKLLCMKYKSMGKPRGPIPTTRDEGKKDIEDKLRGKTEESLDDGY